MNASQRPYYFRNALLLAIFLLMWNPFPANSFQQNTGQAGMRESGKPSGITMLEVSGKVVETMNSGGYSYALVDKDGVKTWVALPKSRIAVGDEITCRSGMVMKNFRSASLNRIFEQIVFSPGLTSTTGTAANSGETASPDEALEEPKPKPPEDWKNF